MKLTRHTRAVAFATLAYGILTLAYSWPLPINMMRGVAHDAGDPLLNAWIMWWSTRAMPLTQAWWNAPMFYPAAGTFAFSEHLLGQAPLAVPLIALTGSPLFGYNVVLLATYVLSGLGGYFLAFTLTRRHDASFVAGLAFAFAPYRVAQLPHIQVLTAFWTPVCLAALHKYDREPSARWAALAAGAWLMQSLSNGYFMFFLSVLLALWFAWFAIGRWSIAQFARVAGFFLVAAMLLLPFLLGYRAILHDTYGFSRHLGTIQDYSADVGALFHASSELWLWGWVRAVPKAEGELFPGPTIVLLSLFAILAARPFAASAELTPARRWLRRIFAVLFVVLLIASLMPFFYGSWRLTVGGVRLVSIARADKPMTLAALALIGWMSTLPMMVAAVRRRSVLPFYTLAVFVMWVLALGPDPTFFGNRALYEAPYRWLMRLPGFDGLRVPARFWMMCLVCLSVLAALAINRLHGRARRVVVALAAAGLVLDGWPKTFFVLPEPERRPAPPGIVARLDLPLTLDVDAQALYQQTFEEIPLYNGFSGYGAPHLYPMRELLLAGDVRILQALTSRGAVGVVIDHHFDEKGQHRQFVAAYPGARLHESHATWSSYVLPAGQAGDLLPDRAGQPVPIKSLDAFPSPPHTPRALDGNLRTRWSGGVQRAAADFTIELEQAGRVAQVVAALGEFMTDFPIRLRVSVSPDGSQWEIVHDGDTMLHAYYAAVRYPREIPLVIPVDRDNVRFIRLQQMGWGKHDWSIAEIQVRR